MGTEEKRAEARLPTDEGSDQSITVGPNQPDKNDAAVKTNGDTKSQSSSFVYFAVSIILRAHWGQDNPC